MKEYKEAILTLFDFWGFKDVIDSTKETLTIAEKLAAFMFVSSPTPGVLRKYHVDFTAFSDLSVRIIDLERKEGECEKIYKLISEIEDLCCKESSLCQFHDILIRGAMTIDSVCIFDTTVGEGIFGRSLNEAYRLERDIAIYPRIILDSKVIRYINDYYSNISRNDNGLNDDQEGTCNFKYYFRQDSDGLWYVDYLGLSMKKTISSYERIEEVKKHRDIIVNKYRKYRESLKDKQPKEMKLDRLLTQFFWLAKYHNSVVEDCYEDYLSENGTPKTELIIAAKDIGYVFDL